MLNVYLILGIIIVVSLISGVILVVLDKKKHPPISFGEDPNTLFESDMKSVPVSNPVLEQGGLNSGVSFSADEKEEVEPFVAREGITGAELSERISPRDEDVI